MQAPPIASIAFTRIQEAPPMHNKPQRSSSSMFRKTDPQPLKALPPIAGKGPRATKTRPCATTAQVAVPLQTTEGPPKWTW